MLCEYLSGASIRELRFFVFWVVRGFDLTVFNKIEVNTKTGGSRAAKRHTFLRQQKYAKVPSPSGGHFVCGIRVVLIDSREGNPALS